ncbi:hypothetical protein D3C79_706930 [compost metagenome]
MAQGNTQGLLNGLELPAKLSGPVGRTHHPARANPGTHGLDRGLQGSIVQPGKCQGTPQGIDQHQQPPIDTFLTPARKSEAVTAVIQVIHFRKGCAHTRHVVLEILTVTGALSVNQTLRTAVMAGASCVTDTDACAKQPGDIGGVSDLGLEQVVIEVVAGAVEKQADV